MLLGELFHPVHVNQPETPTKYKKKFLICYLYLKMHLDFRLVDIEYKSSLLLYAGS